MSSDQVLSKIRRDFILQLAREGRRLDERRFDQYRPLRIEVGRIGKAEGSAEVYLGRTRVMCGVKMQPGTPYPDTPNEGVMTTSAELRPMASPDFEAGPPGEDAIELARVVDRGIRESKLIDTAKLCIAPGEKVWMCFVDMHILDFDGNLLDACSYGALAALLTAAVPALGHEVGDHDYRLPVSPSWPISCTTAKIGTNLMADPGLEEESVMDARLTVALDEEGDVRAMQKGLNGSFSLEEIGKVIDATQRSSSSIREQVRRAVDEHWATRREVAKAPVPGPMPAATIK